MQRKIGTQVNIGKNISAFESIGHVPSIDKPASEFDKADTKVKKLKRLVATGEYDADVARYIPGTLELVYQEILDDIKTIEQPAHPSHKYLGTFDFQLLLDKNLYTNLNSVHFVFPMKIKRKSDINADIVANLVTVNNFFARRIKEISTTKYGTNKELTPTTTSREIYQYSDAMLKHLPQKSLKVIQHDHLYSQKPAVILYGFDTRVHGSLRKADGTLLLPVDTSDDNFDDTEAKFRNQLKNKYVYRVMRKINFPTKADMQIRLTLETDMKKLFDTKKIPSWWS